MGGLVSLFNNDSGGGGGKSTVDVFLDFESASPVLKIYSQDLSWLSYQ